jgi:hypothetical protein
VRLVRHEVQAASHNRGLRLAPHLGSQLTRYTEQQLFVSSTALAPASRPHLLLHTAKYIMPITLDTDWRRAYRVSAAKPEGR